MTQLSDSICLEGGTLYVGEGICSFSLSTSRNAIVVEENVNRDAEIYLNKEEVRILISQLEALERELI
jgi:hypothetical protein